jgi:hypothetical protein
MLRQDRVFRLALGGPTGLFGSSGWNRGYTLGWFPNGDFAAATGGNREISLFDGKPAQDAFLQLGQSHDSLPSSNLFAGTSASS